MKKILFILLILAIPALLLAAEPVREWKSKDGQKTQAAYDSSRDTDPATVPLIKNGKKSRVKFENLSKADQDYVTDIRSRSGDAFPMEEESRDSLLVPAGNRYVLLIGVNEYVKPIKSLEFCVKDMELLSNCFQNLGVPKENIFLVTDDSPAARRPTGANIRRQIENVTSLMEPDDQLIVAFSGHGVMVGGKSYLCPSDTNLKDKNSIVSCDWVFEQLEKCKAKQKVFIIDACRSELTFGGDKTADGARTIEDPIGADTHGFIRIASCDKTQRSWEHPDLEHGVFTHFFAEGLSGAAADEDGYITIIGLFQYTSSRTKKYVFHEFNEVQVPTFRQGGEMTDFNLARVDGALPIGEQNPPSSQKLSLGTPGTKAGEQRIITVNDVEFSFRWCPAGSFTMGSPESEQGRDDSEKEHQVIFTKGFWMLETEVTQKQWKAIMNTNPSHFKGDDLPVEKVSWYDCQDFCRICTELGMPVQLPTESQWEYACRAGSKTAYFWGDVLRGENANADDVFPSGTANNGKNIKSPTPVGSYAPNAWGLYDMHGNAWEWCQDYYGIYPDGSVTDPVGPSTVSGRVYRGGGWSFDSHYCRSAYRGSLDPELSVMSLGFRVVNGQ